ncbi:MAG: DUF433 domain-containing protein [Hyphomicrobiales bacterium]
MNTNPDLISRITMIPGLCGGRPTIRGLRIRVKDVLDLLAAGASRQAILADYPYLQDDDITAALLYSSAQLDHRVLAAE